MILEGLYCIDCDGPMIDRHLKTELYKLLIEYPVVTLLGPRQAGKTTLARSALPDYHYCNLEHPETRQFAQDDSKAFLAQYKSGVILDEIQCVPELLSCSREFLSAAIS